MGSLAPSSRGRTGRGVGTGDRLGALALLVFALLFLAEARGLPFGTLQRPGAAFMPVILGGLLAGVAGLLLLLGRGSPLHAIDRSELWHAGAVLAACAFAAAALERLGYRITIAVTLVFLLGVIERNRPVVVVALAAGVPLVSYWVFRRLGVILPDGVLGF